jgi:putative molybdopterin biosynthesis protein
MSENSPYTPEEIAKILKISKFTVYEMIKRGDLAAYHIGRKVRVDARDLDLYIQKSKGTGPASMPSAAPAPLPSGFIICGQDTVLDILTRYLEKELPQVSVLRNYVGSMDGLLALYHNTANVATSHLWDGDTDTYNLPYIRSLLPGHRAVLINLVYRNIGFYVAKNNPLNITGWQDLTKPGLRLINRERGSGARVLLDEQLRKLDIDFSSLQGYGSEETSHLTVASTVARGDADVGVGIEKAALQVANVEFIPLRKERYDIVIRKEDIDKPHFQTLLAILRSTALRDQIAGLGGYDTIHTGQIMGQT